MGILAASSFGLYVRSSAVPARLQYGRGARGGGRKAQGRPPDDPTIADAFRLPPPARLQRRTAEGGRGKETTRPEKRRASPDFPLPPSAVSLISDLRSAARRQRGMWLSLLTTGHGAASSSGAAGIGGRRGGRIVEGGRESRRGTAGPSPARSCGWYENRPPSTVGPRVGALVGFERLHIVKTAFCKMEDGREARGSSGDVPGPRLSRVA